MKLDAFATCVGKTGQLVPFSMVFAVLLMRTLNPLRLIPCYLAIGPMMKLNLYYDMWKSGLLFGRFIEYMPFQGDAFHGPTFDEWKEQLERVSGGSLY